MVCVHRGSILLSVLIWCMSIVAAPDCSLDIRSTDGLPVSTVGSGIPFQVVVTMRDCKEQPIVMLDEAPFAAIRRTSVQTRTINGYSTITYVYSARIDRLGSYSIGPAEVTVGGAVCKTNSCPIVVDTQEKSVNKRLMMELSVDDAQVFVGQETTIRVHVYSAMGVPEVESLHIAKVDDLVIDEFQMIGTGTVTKEGVKYWYREFAASAYVQAAGSFLIPAYSADVRDDQARRSSFFFFSTIAPTKQIFSNTVSMTASVLPKLDKPYALIGEYESIDAYAEPSLVDLGQAIRYRIVVFGTGNKSVARAPLLSDVPSSCKYYDSSITEPSDQDGIIFEYIIQPRQAGTWEIPAQEVVYFSPADKKYYALQAPPVTITANPSALATPEADDDAAAHRAHTTLQQYHPDLSAADPVVRRSWHIPWLWYWLLVGLLCAIGVGMLGVRMVRAYVARHYGSYRKRTALYRARKAIDALERGTNSVSLYRIFITFFADWFMVMPEEVTEAFIKKNMKMSGLLSEDGVESWNRFWHTVVREQYGAADSKKFDKTVYAEARLWITAFSKCGMQ